MPRRRRAEAEGPKDNEDRWLLTYSDMITLLFVLFVVMYAISNTDMRKFVALAQSVSAAFNADVMQGQTPLTIMSGQETVPMDKNYDSGSGVVATDMRTVEAALKDYAIQNGVGGDVEVARVPEGIVIRVNDALLFSQGRANLDEKARAVVARIADVIRPLPNQIRVEGNTDDQAPNGTDYPNDNNWDLSTARAIAVLHEFETLALPSSRLSAAGYAEFNPIVPNTDDASRARNRRVDILLLYPQVDAEQGASSSAVPTPSFP